MAVSPNPHSSSVPWCVKERKNYEKGRRERERESGEGGRGQGRKRYGTPPWTLLGANKKKNR